MSRMAKIPVITPFQRFRYFAKRKDHLGRVPQVDGSARLVGDCGDAVEFSLTVRDNRIVDIRFMPDGCDFTRACSGVVAELAAGRTLEAALEIDPRQVELELGGLPQDHFHCARLAVNTLGEAVADCIGRQKDRTMSPPTEKIILVTSKTGPWSELASALSADPGTELTWAGSGREALAAVKGSPVDLVIVDERLGDMSGLEFVRKLLPVNALVNTAVVSSLPEEEFHEVAEGLGVLARLGPGPGRAEAEELLGRLKALKSAMSVLKTV